MFMTMNKTNPGIKIFVTITFLGMVTVNALASILPINGQDTGQVSDSFPNLFAPTGLTFSIWGLIYLLLAAYTLYQLGLLQDDKGAARAELLNRTGLYFGFSSLANAAWIFAWHYNFIALSLVFMVTILALLIAITFGINHEIKDLSTKEKFFIRLPFSIYFGWITVATIANVTTLLVSIGWKGFNLSEPIWTIIILIIGAIIGIATMLKFKDIAYGLVIVWAYIGIWIKHSTAGAFAGQYPAVITTVVACIALLIIAELFLLRTRNILAL